MAHLLACFLAQPSPVPPVPSYPISGWVNDSAPFFPLSIRRVITSRSDPFGGILTRTAHSCIYIIQSHVCDIQPASQPVSNDPSPPSFNYESSSRLLGQWKLEEGVRPFTCHLREEATFSHWVDKHGGGDGWVMRPTFIHSILGSRVIILGRVDRMMVGGVGDERVWVGVVAILASNFVLLCDYHYADLIFREKRNFFLVICKL